MDQRESSPIAMFELFKEISHVQASDDGLSNHVDGWDIACTGI
jgi:hypothetical protein